MTTNPKFVEVVKNICSHVIDTVSVLTTATRPLLGFYKET